MPLTRGLILTTASDESFAVSRVSSSSSSSNNSNSNSNSNRLGRDER